MKTVVVSRPGPEGGVTASITVLERKDPVAYLDTAIGEHKIIDELEYMGLKTIGQFIDEYDEIVKRIVDRFPSFFDGEEYGIEEIREALKSVDMDLNQ